MDERLEKALAFGKYTRTITNQKQNLKNRLYQMQIVHYKGGVFIANHETIAFVKSIVDLGHTEFTILDSKENSIPVMDIKALLNVLVQKYEEAVREYDTELQKLKKSRSISAIMEL